MTAGDHESALAELDRAAPELLGHGRPMRLANRLDELAGLDFRGHPWARLLVACALYDTDPTDGRWRAHLKGALRAFRARRDGQGVAYACFVLGCRALERGNIAQAAAWWEKARKTAGPVPPGLEIMLAHGCLGMYAEGRLCEAEAMSQEAVAQARLRGRSRAEATALVNLAFMRSWTGEFSLALQALNEAADAFAEIPDPFDRYESPLCFAALGAVHAHRGDMALAEKEFAQAVTTAQQVRAGWYEAIARALRAEFTAQADPRRARADARWAIAELGRRGDQWWSTWAAQAAGVAAAAAGMPKAAETAFLDVLAQAHVPRLERAKSLLLLAELRLSTGQGSEAVPVLREAAGIFSEAGAEYWHARCLVRLAAADPAHAGSWITQARRHCTQDPAYELLFRADALELSAFGPGQIVRGGQPVSGRTHNSERTLFMLALAGTGGLHVEQLADRLWTDPRVERDKRLGRVRTLLWEAKKEILGTQRWRLERREQILMLDMTDVAFDLADARRAADEALRSADPRLARAAASRLRDPVLTRWQYEDWVREEQLRNESLCERLSRLVPRDW